MTTRRRAVEYLITIALVLIIASVAMDARCEDVDVVKPSVLYLSLSAADLGSTEWAIRHGATEGNPAMQSNRYAKQAAIAGAFLGADVYLQSKGNKREARALRFVYAVVRVAAIVVNLHNARKESR